MKHLLLSTSALLLTAGVASADVSVGGDGRMGVVYDDSLTNEFAFTSRIRISFTASGETDGGLTFGGSIRADNAGTNGTAGTGGVNGTAGSVFISGAFGRLSMGDVDGAAEFVVGDLHGVGLTGLGDQNEFYYMSNNPDLTTPDMPRPSARYDHAIGDFRFAVSVDNPASAYEIYAVGLGYTFGNFGFAAGYEDGTTPFGSSFSNYALGVNATFGNTTVRAIFGESTGASFGETAQQYGISVAHTMGALSVSAFVREFELHGDGIYVNGAVEGAMAMGIGFAYDLGGGASLTGGIMDSDDCFSLPALEQPCTRADFGVAFTF